MTITEVATQRFRTKTTVVRDSAGHSHPGPEHEGAQVLLRIATDDGAEGYAFGANPQVIAGIVKPALLGQDPRYRERIWQDLKERQRLHMGALSDKVLASVDLALWDLAGRATGQPVHKLLGAFRDAVPAYASTMCGDTLEGGLDSPEAYARFAVACKDRGYPAFKLHTWQPPIPGAPDVKRDIAACRAVREAVGPEMDLMLDPFHY
jgi:L-alanine-DL-glutamate epimerase-like enolase superfamily enzyme